MKQVTATIMLFALIITMLCLLIYAAVQQTYRTGANDPQIQMATDIDTKLHHAISIESYFKDSVFIPESHSSFTVIYNLEGKPVRSSGIYHNGMLPIPAGVFIDLKNGDRKEITTQPDKETRLAIVIIKTGISQYQYIAVGRILKDVEERTANLGKMVISVWFILLSILLIYGMFCYYTRRAEQNRHNN